MQLPSFVGKVVYIGGYFIFRIKIKDTHRAYVAVIVDEKLLVTKNWLGLQKNWRLPGGGVQTGESATQAAIRELREEVGITAAPIDLKPLTEQPLKAVFNYQYDLFVLQLKTMPIITIDKHEILFANFVSKEELLTLPISEEVAQVVVQLGWS